MGEAAEQELIRQAQQGSAAAFEALVVRYESRVRGLCQRILGSPADAEDAAISALVKAWRSLRRYDLSRPFYPWLSTIAAREAVSLARSRRPWVPFDEIEGGGGTNHPGLAAGGPPDPEAAAVAQEESQAVLQALARLGTAARTAVVLRYELDQSYAEIAAALGVPVGTVGTLLHRAKAQLRRDLEEDEA